VVGLDHLVVRSRDVDATRAFYAEVLGLRVLFDREFADCGVRLCMLRVDDAVLEIAGRLGTAAPGKDPKSSEVETTERDRIWGLTWRVGDADAARSRLAGLALDVSPVRAGRRPGTRVFTVRDGTCGVPTLIIEPSEAARRTAGSSGL
jgi:catechol 2,3-dioxygenase-like lactoylglutathione lyase family enzyme